ncbi:hypothetical protein LzC2_33970 [Planctomycetes bacterium LzC2]|uniref:Uncharacterized protein n=1 Tax=Alienimonas chondri TaxID=2681879 RepID=A0ABX1VGT5_9PLAN|nr:hypothetical protein [Alienimonas chondri]
MLTRLRSAPLHFSVRACHPGCRTWQSPCGESGRSEEERDQRRDRRLRPGRSGAAFLRGEAVAFSGDGLLHVPTIATDAQIDQRGEPTDAGDDVHRHPAERREGRGGRVARQPAPEAVRGQRRPQRRPPVQQSGAEQIRRQHAEQPAPRGRQRQPVRPTEQRDGVGAQQPVGVFVVQPGGERPQGDSLRGEPDPSPDRQPERRPQDQQRPGQPGPIVEEEQRQRPAEQRPHRQSPQHQLARRPGERRPAGKTGAEPQPDRRRERRPDGDAPRRRRQPRPERGGQVQPAREKGQRRQAHAQHGENRLAGAFPFGAGTGGERVGVVAVAAVFPDGAVLFGERAPHRDRGDPQAQRDGEDQHGDRRDRPGVAERAADDVRQNRGGQPPRRGESQPQRRTRPARGETHVQRPARSVRGEGNRERAGHRLAPSSRRAGGFIPPDRRAQRTARRSGTSPYPVRGDKPPGSRGSSGHSLIASPPARRPDRPGPPAAARRRPRPTSWRRPHT